MSRLLPPTNAAWWLNTDDVNGMDSRLIDLVKTEQRNPPSNKKLVDLSTGSDYQD